MNRRRIASRTERTAQADAGRVGAATLSAAVLAAGSHAAEPRNLQAVLERLPADEYEAGRQVCRELMKDGPAGLARLFSMVADPGYESGVKPRYAVHALAVYSSRPGAADERKTVAKALADRLDADLSDEVKSFFVRQLQLAGTKAEVSALAKLLGHDKLCEPATQALLAIGGNGAAEALRNALPKSRGPRRVTIIQGLGFLRDRGAVRPLRRAARAKRAEVRLAALYALGNIGDPRAAEELLAAAKTEKGYEQTQAVDACLKLAARLGEQGNKNQAADVLQKLEKSHGESIPVHVRCAVLDGLAEALGPAAVQYVLPALEADQLRYRAAAAGTAVRLAGRLKADRKKDAKALLEKTLKATEDETLLQEARALLKDLG